MKIADRETNSLAVRQEDRQVARQTNRQMDRKEEK